MLKKKIIFLSFYEENYSRSAVLLKSGSSVYEKIFYKLNNKSRFILSETRRIFKTHKGEIVSIVIMSPSHKLVPIIRFLCRYPIILDAGWPLIDGNASRKGINFRWNYFRSISNLKLILLDILSFNLADLVLVETSMQLKKLKKKYFFRHANLDVSFTGFNEAGQLQKSEIDLFKPSPYWNGKQTCIRILFRGKINLESGFSTIREAFRMLNENFAILYVIDHIPQNLKLLSNERIITKYEDSELTYIYQQADICIGQISSHQRLEVTIPHKAFEAAFFSKAYISAESVGMKEFANAADIFYLKEITPGALSQAIVDIASDSILMRNLGINFHSSYLKKASQKILGDKFDERVTNLIYTNSLKR